MERTGYFKIYRKLFDHWLWTDKPFSKGQAWIDIVGLANHSDNELMYMGKLIKGKRGEVNRSLNYLADRWGWSKVKVKRFLEILESEQMIKLEVTKRTTIITIENYDYYQPTLQVNQPKNNQETNQEMTEGNPKSDRRATANNNVNNVNNYKNDYYYPPRQPRNRLMTQAEIDEALKDDPQYQEWKEYEKTLKEKR